MTHLLPNLIGNYQSFVLDCYRERLLLNLLNVLLCTLPSCRLETRPVSKPFKFLRYWSPPLIGPSLNRKSLWVKGSAKRRNVKLLRNKLWSLTCSTLSFRLRKQCFTSVRQISKVPTSNIVPKSVPLDNFHKIWFTLTFQRSSCNAKRLLFIFQA